MKTHQVQQAFHGIYGHMNVRHLATSPCIRNVRTRFAPSPTGDLHLGSLRSALYNYLFARSRGGSFLLRVEDTDQKRTVPGAVDRLLHTLDMMGLRPDEGPGVGGPRGPYIQSERTELYRDVTERLLHDGAAYRCFCTKNRLEMLRRQAIGRGEKPRYDNRCRHLSDEKRNHLLERRVPHVVRLKLEDTSAPFDDLVCGAVSFDASREGDPVLMKTDGFPTYHLANVVDDHQMDVTHVLRGVEWQVSTPKHIALYRALGWTPPEFAHLPLVTNPDGTKLSKRHSDATVEQHLERGYLPEALLNYVCLAGGGFRELDQTALTDVQQLVQQFDLSRVHTHSCRLDPERLKQLNVLALRRRHEASHGVGLLDELRGLVRQRLNDSGVPLSERVLSDTYVRRVLDWALTTSRIVTLADLVGRDFAYLWSVPGGIPADRLAAVTDPAGALSLVTVELASWPEERLTKDHLVPLFRSVAQRCDLKFSTLMMLIRLAISGVEEGPGVAEMMAVLGHAETIQRLSNSATHMKAGRAAHS